MRRLPLLLVLMMACAITSVAQSFPFTITTASVPNVVVGQSYPAFRLDSTNGIGTVNWSIASGSPPPGFVVGVAQVGQSPSSGTFCFGTQIRSAPPVCDPNTPIQSTPGLYTFTITAVDGQGQTDSRQFTLIVAATIQITTPSLPTGLVGQGYGFTLQMTGGVGPFIWSVASGTLPAGFSLDQFTGVLFNPSVTTFGSFPLTVLVSDTNTGASASKAFTLNLILGQLLITTASLPPAIQGIPYQATVAATSGAPPYRWRFATASTQGLSIDLITGVITGTPPVAGTFPLPIEVMDVTQTVVQKIFTLQVGPPLSIVTTTLPTAIQGVAYQTTVTASGGLAPYRWTFGPGNSQGLSINLNTGVITGAPLAAGTLQLPIIVTDATQTAVQKSFTLQIGPALSITTSSIPPGAVGTAYQTTITAAGGLPPYKFRFATAATQGLSIDLNTGVITGVPTTVGTFQLPISVDDATPTIVQQNFSFQVVAALSITTASPLPAGVVGTPYSQQLVAAGGQTPRTWSLVNPPAGIQISSGGLLTVSTATAGTQTFTVQVTDTFGFTAQKTFTVTIATVMTITSPGVFTGTVGVPFTATLVAAGGLPPYRWTQNGTLPGGLQFNTSTGVISGTPDSRASFSLSFSVNDASTQFAIQQVVININLPPLPPGSIGVGTSTQPPVSVTISAPYPADITGTLTLTFASSVGGTDDTVRFSNGTRALNFVIPTGATVATFTGAPNAAVIPGTVAGTITLRVTAMDSSGVSILPTAPIVNTIPVTPAKPVINSVVLQKVTGGINVVVTGFSNTREISSGTFHFSLSTGADAVLSQADFTVALTAAYTTWFSNTLANATGGQFKLTMPFTVAEGAETLVTSVEATLTNSIGASNTVKSQ